MAQPICIVPKPYPTVPRNIIPIHPTNIFFYVYSINGPLANATVQLLQYYNSVTAKFETLTKNTCNPGLPLYAITNKDGYANLCMLSGTYIIQFSANEYNTVTKQYTFLESTTVKVELLYAMYEVLFLASGANYLVTPNATFDVTFTESGLPSGTSWSVTFNGNTQTSTSNSIVFYNLANGTYDYTVNSVTGYAESPASGSVTINNASVTVDITFTIVDVTFTESGLPSGTSWSVTFNGNTQTSTSNSIVFYNLANGTYDYTVKPVTGYVASPASGSVTINNASVTVDITFTKATYVYAGYGTNPGIVDQINTSAMTLNQSFTAPSGHSAVYALTYDGTYIYAGYDTSPGIVDQIIPSTLTVNKTFTAPSGHTDVISLTYDGTYIYVGYDISPGIVDQINTSTMTLNQSFTAPSGHNKVYALTYDGTYIYAGYYTSPGIVDQIIPSSMALNKTFTAPSGHNDVLSLTYDGTYVYAGYHTTPGYVDQIIPSTLTVNKTFTAPSGHKFVFALTYDGTYIYAGYWTSPGIVDQIIPSSMALNKTFTAPSGHNDLDLLTYDGTFIYAGYAYTNPGVVDQINTSAMTLNQSFTAPSGHNNMSALTQGVIKGNNYAVFGK